MLRGVDLRVREPIRFWSLRKAIRVIHLGLVVVVPLEELLT